MNNKPSDLNDFFVTTILADLFDPAGSDDLDVIAQKIVDGLEENGLLHDTKQEDDELMAA